MDRLGRDVLLEVARRIYYPTELINLALVCKAFKHLGTDERLFKTFWLREFQSYAPDFTSEFLNKIPENWTWKQVFVWLFKTKRELISKMYHHVGLVYERDFRGELDEKATNKLHFMLFLGYKDGTSPEERYQLPTGRAYLIDRSVTGSLFFTLARGRDRKRMVEMIDTVHAHQGKWDLRDNWDYPVEEEYRKGLYGGKPLGKRAIVKEGVCIWDKVTESYKLIYPLDGLRDIFNGYKYDIMRERNLKVRAAEELLNELYNLEYQCDEITNDNYKQYEIAISERMKESELAMIDYYYIYGLKVLSFSVIRAPHWENKEPRENQVYGGWPKGYQIPIYDWKGTLLDTKELMEYPYQCKNRYGESGELKFPETLHIESLEKKDEGGKILTLALKNSEKIPAAFPHVSHGSYLK